jgi:adenylate cyclase
MLWLDVSGIDWVAKLIQRAELLVYDMRLNATLPDKPTVDDRIVIVTIDEKSLRQQGHWPWPRDKLALMTKRMLESGAAVIGFDVMFAEAEENSARQLLRDIGNGRPERSALRGQIAALADEVNHDRVFARSLQGGDIVLGYTFRNDSAEQSNLLPPPVGDVAGGTKSMIAKMPSYTGNLPVLQQAARHGGFVTTLPDNDGILRRSPFLIQYGDHLYGSLSLEMARLFYLLDDVTVNMARIGDRDAVESIKLGSVTIPTDGAGRVIIPYRGVSPAFHRVSATDILNGRFDPSLFENKIVLVGATALGLSDLVATPVQSVYPGVEVHASLIEGILDKHFPVEPSWARGANLSVMLAAGLVLALLLPWLGPGLLLSAAAAVAAVLIGTNFWLWHTKGLVLQLAMPLQLVTVLAVFNLAYGFLGESRQRNRLKDMFGQYVPPPLVEQMMRRPDRFTTEGESRELTVLFADIRNFTALSEALSPNELKNLLNSFFTPMTRIIFEKRGTIDKYVGDMIMAFWGAPLPDERHALHAVEAGLAMLTEVERLKAEFARRGLPEINIGIGLNTGIMNVGDMGSEFRRAYTVIGDAVNLASRIEGLTKYYGVGMVIGEDTYRQLDNIVCRKLDRVRVKGKTKGVEVYQPLCRRDQASDALHRELESYHRALELYWDKQWDAAHDSFEQLAALHPETEIYTLYLQRIAEIRDRPMPADWDGIYERRTK